MKYNVPKEAWKRAALPGLAIVCPRAPAYGREIPNGYNGVSLL
ncbi:hypothetical protein MTsPCn7_02750 [Altererythrobacter sp. MTPC7]